MIAYDYKAQRWVEGREGTVLRLAQLHQEEAELFSPRGQDYLAFTGSNLTLADAQAAVTSNIAECEAELRETSP